MKVVKFVFLMEGATKPWDLIAQELREYCIGPMTPGEVMATYEQAEMAELTLNDYGINVAESFEVDYNSQKGSGRGKMTTIRAFWAVFVIIPVIRLIVARDTSDTWIIIILAVSLLNLIATVMPKSLRALLFAVYAITAAGGLIFWLVGLGIDSSVMVSWSVLAFFGGCLSAFSIAATD